MSEGGVRRCRTGIDRGGVRGGVGQSHYHGDLCRPHRTARRRLEVLQHLPPCHKAVTDARKEGRGGGR